VPSQNGTVDMTLISWSAVLKSLFAFKGLSPGGFSPFIFGFLKLFPKLEELLDP
jgi:hypothetical protein